MSKNISNLSGRIGLKKNLFQKISDRSLKTNNADGIKEIAEEYRMGVSTIHGAESFYEFLRPSHREKKHLYAMVVLVCVLALKDH